MRNKRVKQMICDVMAKKYQCPSDYFWFDDGCLMMYQEPHGFFEGDEVEFYWEYEAYPYTSLTADQLKTIK